MCRARDPGAAVPQGDFFGQHNVEELRPNDLQAAARDFPELTFIIYHLARPYFDEVVKIVARFPNIHVVALSGNLGSRLLSPRLVQEQIGRLLMDVGSEKQSWGSGAGFTGPPRPYLEAFMNLEIPQDLRVGYGYPQLTGKDLRNTLGLNFARLMDIDSRGYLRGSDVSMQSGISQVNNHGYRVDRGELTRADASISAALRGHAGGIELVDFSSVGHVEIQFTGMCTACPCKALTMVATVVPALEQTAGDASVSAAGTNSSDEARERLRLAFSGEADNRPTWPARLTLLSNA